MTLKATSTDMLMQLADVIGQLADSEYARPLPVLSGNTIGRHVRHILDCYELLVSSTQTGQLNYDHRQRDLILEVSVHEALRRIGLVDRLIHHLDLNQPLMLAVGLSVAGPAMVQLPTLVARELLHNTEHAIHHMALIQVAVRQAFPAIELPAHFGVANSTVQHQVVSARHVN